MRRIHQLLAGVFLAQCVLSCPDGREYFPIIPKSNSSLGERSLRIRDSVHGTWPKATITYCFDSDLAKDKLKSIVPRAWRLWLDRGLNGDFEMKYAKPSWCSSADREDYLLISYNNNQDLYTTPGYSRPGRSGGPEMTIDPSDGIATGSAVSSVAHEIGHAWGLLHEHQRPSLWTKEYGGDARSNVFNFNCQNLRDYEAMLEKHGHMDRACRYEQAATHMGFSASQLLPEQGNNDVGQPGVVEWDSIMIYGSIAGSKTVNGQRTNTLTKADGSTFGYNLFPSAQDAISLRALYRHRLDEPKDKSTVKMLFDPKNRFHGLWNRRHKPQGPSACQ